MIQSLYFVCKSAEKKKVIFAMKESVAQILEIIVTVLCLISCQMKRRWQMLAISLCANLLSGLSFLLLGKFSATGVTTVAIFQILLGIRHNQANKAASKVENIVFFCLYTFGGLLPYIVGGTLGSFGWLDVLPILAALLLMCSVIQREEQKMRIFGLLNATVFLVYNAILKNTQFFAQLFSLISIISALIRYRKKAAPKVHSISSPGHPKT